MAHGAFEGGAEGFGVVSNLAVDDDGFFDRMDELDRVFDRDNVLGEIRVNVIDHRGERGRFAGAGGSGDDDETFLEVAEFFEGLGEFEFVEGEDLGRDLAEDGGLAPVVAKEVGAEAGETGDLVGEVEVAAFEKFSPAFRWANFFEQLLHRGGVDGVGADGLEGAGDAGFGREADGEMEVGAALFEHGLEEGVDGGHG